MNSTRFKILKLVIVEHFCVLLVGLQRMSCVSMTSALHCISLHCTALHCTPLHCIALHCTSLHSTPLHSTPLHFTAMHSTPLHSTALHCNALHCTALHCNAMHCTALHSTALHCTSPHCTLLHFTALHSTALHFTALYFTSLHCTARHCTTLNNCLNVRVRCEDLIFNSFHFQITSFCHSIYLNRSYYSVFIKIAWYKRGGVSITPFWSVFNSFIQTFPLLCASAPSRFLLL